ncbi:GNAT family N-acetyltransferase [Enterococcus sp. LJL98]
MIETLETQRLILRKITTEDATEAFNHWTNSKQATKYLTWEPHETVEVTRAWFLYQEQNQSHEWGIVLKETNQLMGNISVVEEKSATKTKTLGYVLGEQFWSQGYMSEALTAVIAHLFETTDVNRVEAAHDVANPGSGRVMEKAGMTFEGVLRQSGINNQGVVDMAFYSVLRSERE